MNQVEQFIEAAGGRISVAAFCGVKTETARIWIRNNEIPRQYLHHLEKLARDKRCFGAFKRAAIARGDFGCEGGKTVLLARWDQRTTKV